MRDLEKYRGQYTISASGGAPQFDVSSRMIHAEWISSLDKSDTLNLSLAISSRERGDLSQEHFPKNLSLKWQEKNIFKGELLSASFSGHSKLNLTYRDSLFYTKKMIDDEFIKNEVLSESLKKICKKASLEIKCYGSFSEKIPSFYLGDRSLYENLKILSDHYGFFFYCHAPSHVVYFMKLGSHTSKVNIDWKKSIQGYELSQRSDLTWKEVEFRVFDPKTQASKEKKIQNNKVYAPLESLNVQGSFGGKLNWPFARGEYETHASSVAEFEGGETRIQNQLSKQAVQQEMLIFKSHEALCLPGDEIQLENVDIPGLLKGRFLVQMCHLVLNSSIPKMFVYAGRP